MRILEVGENINLWSDVPEPSKPSIENTDFKYATIMLGDHSLEIAYTLQIEEYADKKIFVFRTHLPQIGKASPGMPIVTKWKNYTLTEKQHFVTAAARISLMMQNKPRYSTGSIDPISQEIVRMERENFKGMIIFILT